MRSHLEKAWIAFLLGIGAFGVFFIVGSLANNDDTGMVAFCISTFLGGLLFIRKSSKSFWYAPAIISLPAFLVLAGPADPGQLKYNFPGIIISLVCGYAGAIIGVRFLRKTKVEEVNEIASASTRWVKTFRWTARIIGILAIAIFFFCSWRSLWERGK